MFGGGVDLVSVSKPRTGRCLLTKRGCLHLKLKSKAPGPELDLRVEPADRLTTQSAFSVRKPLTETKMADD